MYDNVRGAYSSGFDTGPASKQGEIEDSSFEVHHRKGTNSNGGANGRTQSSQNKRELMDQYMQKNSTSKDPLENISAQMTNIYVFLFSLSLLVQYLGSLPDFYQSVAKVSLPNTYMALNLGGGSFFSNC